jgi:hypothetical protein
MFRLAAGGEDLDDGHAAAAARARAGQYARIVRRGALLRLNDARRGAEQLAGAGDVGGAIAVAEQAIVVGSAQRFLALSNCNPSADRQSGCMPGNGTGPPDADGAMSGATRLET